MYQHIASSLLIEMDRRLREVAVS